MGDWTMHCTYFTLLYFSLTVFRSHNLNVFLYNRVTYPQYYPLKVVVGPDYVLTYIFLPLLQVISIPLYRL
jgi:hypothetical protein